MEKFVITTKYYLITSLFLLHRGPKEHKVHLVHRVIQEQRLVVRSLLLSLHVHSANDRNLKIRE